MPSNFVVSNTFVANTRALSAAVNTNFTDVLNILKAHHHDPNIYTGAIPITNSGIADNAKILDTQLNIPITRSGLIDPASLIPVTVPKGGTGLAGAFGTGDLLYASGANVLARLIIGSAGQSLQVTGGIPAWATTTQNAMSVNLTAGEAINAGTTPQAAYVKASDGKIYKSDTDADESTYLHIGFVANGQNVAINDSVTVITNGIVAGFTGLTQNAFYYITGTAGTISVTPDATRPRRVALAISTTSILILGNQKIRNVTDSAASGTTQVTNTKTVGFRAKLIIGTSEAGNGSGQVQGRESFFIATELATYSLRIMGTGGTDTFAVDTSVNEMKEASNVGTIVINNYTETGFDIVYNRPGGGGAGGSVNCIVFGE